MNELIDYPAELGDFLRDRAGCVCLFSNFIALFDKGQPSKLRQSITAWICLLRQPHRVPRSLYWPHPSVNRVRAV